MKQKGKVLKSTGKWYIVELEDESVVNCRIRGKLRLEGLKTTNPISVGDLVKLNPLKDEEGNMIIEEILPRKNYIVRKSTNLSKQKQILASNIDRAYLVVTIHSPNTHLAFIDRFLVSAESFRIPTTILFNKIDLYSEDELSYIEALSHMYERIGYPCHKISAKKHETVAFLSGDVKGKQVMISGHSGVGKSTLINGLDANLNITTNEISQAHQQGKHTTTFAEMHKLDSGGYIVDTPGIRAFGIVDMDKTVISHYFPEMRRLMANCKFNNCLHLDEPNCAVKVALKNNEIDESRYTTYVQLMEEDENDVHRQNQYS
jgi:ribosome biogenesis GTPase